MISVLAKLILVGSLTFSQKDEGCSLLLSEDKCDGAAWIYLSSSESFYCMTWCSGDNTVKVVFDIHKEAR